MNHIKMAFSGAGLALLLLAGGASAQSNSNSPVRAHIFAIPPTTAQDQATMRIRCKEADTACSVWLDCTAQNDGSSYGGLMAGTIPAKGTQTLFAQDIVDISSGDNWSGKGRLACAVRSEQMVSAQIWTRSGDGVLVNNSAAIRSVNNQADIESIPAPGMADISNIRIRCTPEGGSADCTNTRLECTDDEGMRFTGSLDTIARGAVMFFQTSTLSDIIDHVWSGMGFSCRIISTQPFTVQVLTRTGGGGALVNNSATGNES